MISTILKADKQTLIGMSVGMSEEEEMASLRFTALLRESKKNNFTDVEKIYCDDILKICNFLDDSIIPFSIEEALKIAQKITDELNKIKRIYCMLKGKEYHPFNSANSFKSILSAKHFHRIYKALIDQYKLKINQIISDKNFKPKKESGIKSATIIRKFISVPVPNESKKRKADEDETEISSSSKKSK